MTHSHQPFHCSAGVRAAALALLLACPAIALGQEFWRGTRYEMTVEEVQAQVPDAVSAPTPSTLGSGAKGILYIPEVEITNSSFEGTFYFIDRRLTQVMLSLNDPGRFSFANLRFESMLQSLRAKYGAEQSLVTDLGSVMKRREATWLSGRTNITMLLMTIGDNDATLNVVYQVRLAQEADKP